MTSAHRRNFAVPFSGGAGQALRARAKISQAARVASMPMKMTVKGSCPSISCQYYRPFNVTFCAFSISCPCLPLSKGAISLSRDITLKGILRSWNISLGSSDRPSPRSAETGGRPSKRWHPHRCHKRSEHAWRRSRASPKDIGPMGQAGLGQANKGWSLCARSDRRQNDESSPR